MLDIQSDREPGATFALGNILWVDFESRSSASIAAGADRYAREAQAIVLAWAVGDGPVQVEAVPDFAGPLDWRRMPKDLVNAFAHVEAGLMKVCAHNANFDRTIWNQATRGFPHLRGTMVIDTRAQATASGLPAALDAAVRYAGGSHHKDKAGKALIKLFTLADSTATPQSHPIEWQAFLDYAKGDIEAMRDLFQRTRQLPLAEWREYWASEAINDGGVMIDLDLATKAAAMAKVDQHRSGRELTALTGGAVTTVNQVQRLTSWLTASLPSDGRDILSKRAEEVDEDGVVTVPQKWALTRDRVVRLLAWLDAKKPLTPALKAAERALQIRRYGGSKTPAKFAKMLAQQVDGVIRGQYVFNGASQTGRFSAKGVQIHNLMRDPFELELDAIDALLAGMDYDSFAELGDDTPVSRKLSLLIRPTLVAEPGNAFVWGDWSNIEARVTPWLADELEADRRLELFRAVDAGTERYDLYTRTAAAISGLGLDQVDAKIRQRGKVIELACAFGGGMNALLQMAASYGMHLSETEATAAVGRWREDNPWAQRFWGKHDNNGSYGLWGAANLALENPGIIFPAGRVFYLYLRDYLGGSLLCRLPSGRFLTYRKIKWEYVEEKDEDTGEILDIRRELMFSRDMGRMKLWPGLLCENITQACAADILRGTLVRAQLRGLRVRLHSHDEVLCEAKEAKARAVALHLHDIMTEGFTWSNGLPLAAETTIARFYTKCKSSVGL